MTLNNSVLGLLAIVASAVWLAVILRPDDLLHIYFCDVGEGDAIFIKTPQNKQILVDGGPGELVLRCLSNAIPFYDRSLDLLVLTHPHADHVGGLINVLRTYQVQKVTFQQLAYQSADYQEFVDLIRRKKVPVLEVAAGRILALDQQVRAEVYAPLTKGELSVLGASFDPYDDENVNDSSMVMRIVCGDFAGILSGDAGKEVQQLLLKQGVVGTADVLKVAHHGAKDGLDENFLKKVDPRLAVISVGRDNRYGHPHAETLEELKDAGVEVLRTDLNGTIEVVSDCKSWWVR